MGRRKSQKIIRTGPKNATTGMCPVCKTIGKISFLAHLEMKEQNVKNVAKNLNYNSKIWSLHIKTSTHNFLRQIFPDR